VKSVGIEDLRVDRSVNDLLNEFYGFFPGSASMATLLQRWPSEAEREHINTAPQPDFDRAVEDTATPRAMCALLELVFGSDLLSEQSRALLYAIMGRCQTGPGRIKGMLPPGVFVAHKTGTIGGTINDVGVIELPFGRGRFALAVYTKGSDITPYAAREPFVADLSRSVFDFYAFC
jgi:beta-lactamase class A